MYWPWFVVAFKFWPPLFVTLSSKKEATDLMIRITAQTALVCLLALSAAGCAVELPGSALGGFRLAPPDQAGKTEPSAPQRH
jgi:hypothetical protein